MPIGWILLTATIGSSVWVFFDAPRHALSREWSVACLILWAVAFPAYLVARAEVRAVPDEQERARRRRHMRWLTRLWAAKNRWMIIAALVLGLTLTGVALWQLRVFFRGPYMLFLVRHPALVSIPVLAGAGAFVAHLALKLARRALRSRAGAASKAPRSRKRGIRVRAPDPEGEERGYWPRYSLTEFFRDGGWRGRGRRPPPPLFGPAITAVVAVALGFFFAVIVTSAWTGRAIYEHANYGALALETLRGGEVRIKPYEVAKRQSQNGLNSPTERPTNLHIVKVGNELLWTSVRDPDGFFRVLSKPTAGLMSVAAAATASAVRQAGRRYDANFRYGPGMRISESIRWQIYKKKCYTCDIAEMTGVPTSGGPIVIAPYVRYEGNWFVRRPTFGGVYVVHPRGRIDDLSPEEARRNALVRESGRLFPERLARRIADAYKFKRGIWNRLFVHTEQLEVADTEENPQPFLQDFEHLAPQWVTTLKPRGRTFTTAGVMTTDAVTGRTRVWLARRGDSLIGNQRALDIVRGESFPGIDFAQEKGADSAGKFRVVEPRQVFPGGRPQFLLSIIPDAANRVTRSVIVDAASQSVVGTFRATPAGDADLIAYLRTGRRPTDDEEAVRGGEEGALERDEETGAGEPAATLQRLLRENVAEQRRAVRRVSELEQQERDLRRLLQSARDERRRRAPSRNGDQQDGRGVESGG